MSAAALARDGRLLAHAVLYEFRKVAAFRTGFVVREILRGLARPLVTIAMLQVIYAQHAGAEIGGYSRAEAVGYMILVAAFEAFVFHDRALDLSEQIFQGYVTKFLVMPFRYFLLPLGRFVQFTLLQLAVSLALWSAGALALPAVWPLPASALALAQSLVLALLGSYCFLLFYFAVHSLAFWLDVVWSLLVMARFVSLFVAGAMLPVGMLPPGVRAAFEWCFPYWTIAAPIEIFLGRAGSAHFARGVAVLVASALALEAVRRGLWRRGTARYAGSGM